MQLAAQRIALNLHEAGFNVQVANAGRAACGSGAAEAADCGADPAAALERCCVAPGKMRRSIADRRPRRSYDAERTVLDEKKLIPLLDLPRAYANGPRVRDLHLRADGTPDLAAASLEDTR